jgi:ATP-dependent DNA ligase
VQAFVWAFDLLALDGEDLRNLPLEQRKGELKSLLKRAPFGLALNDYVAGDGPALFAQACAERRHSVSTQASSTAIPPP